MADAWNLLKEHSTLIGGDAWENLLNQEGGGSSEPCLGAKDGLIFTSKPGGVVFALTSGKKTFQVSPSIFDFSVSRTPITLECKSVALTFHLTKVLG